MNKDIKTPFGNIPIRTVGEGDLKLAAQHICPICESDNLSDLTSSIDGKVVLNFYYCKECNAIICVDIKEEQLN